VEEVVSLPVAVCCWQYHDFDGTVMPWFTKPFLDELRDRPLLSKARVLEYGAGYSTLWWAKNVAELVSIDHDQAWMDAIRAVLPESPTVRLICEPDQNRYVALADQFGTFDIIVIDGAEREGCFLRAIPQLRPNGWLILDNAEWALTPAMSARLQWNPHHSYPMPGHPDWRTDYWELKVSPMELWNHLSYEQASHAEERRRGMRP
jgi:SAM-dependent methyltransferase